LELPSALHRAFLASDGGQAHDARAHCVYFSRPVRFLAGRLSFALLITRARFG
jgi:hypothetical protein